MNRQFFTRVNLIVLLLALAAAGFQFWRYSVFTVDDAYISYRYAENFASGRGLVFNSGEYVEGYTNFLWVMLLGCLKKIGLDVRVSSVFLGIASSLFTLWCTWAISRHISIRRQTTDPSPIFSRLIQTAAMLYVVSAPSYGLWAVAGLETPLFACVFIGAIWRHLRECSTQSFPVSAILFGILALIRPEGVLYFGLTLAYHIIFHYWNRREILWAAWKPLAMFSSIVTLHVAWRWWYYGDLFPNTYYIKIGGALQLSGIKYVGEFFLAHGGAGLFLVCLLFLIIARYKEYWVGYFITILSVSLVYFVYVGGDWMPEFRFFTPILPLFFLCIQEGLREIWRVLAAKSMRWGTYGVSAIALILLGNNLFFLYKTPPLLTQNDGHVVLGKLLRDNAAPTETLAAIDIGGLAYFSGLRTIDYFGLADKHIARMPPKEYTFTPGFWGRRSFRMKADMEYVLAQSPTFIELNTVNYPAETSQTIPADPCSDLMFRNPAFQQAYIPWNSRGGSTIFVRRDR